MKNSSLQEQIKTAESSAKISTLLSQGATFDQASPKTRRRWKKVAAKRDQELSITKH